MDATGGVLCLCGAGYSLDGDGQTCSDENECDSNNGGCSDVCTNSLGSYTCSCTGDRILKPNGKKCQDPPATCDDGNNGGCEQVKAPTPNMLVTSITSERYHSKDWIKWGAYNTGPYRLIFLNQLDYQLKKNQKWTDPKIFLNIIVLLKFYSLWSLKLLYMIAHQAGID